MLLKLGVETQGDGLPLNSTQRVQTRLEEPCKGTSLGSERTLPRNTRMSEGLGIGERVESGRGAYTVKPERRRRRKVTGGVNQINFGNLRGGGDHAGVLGLREKRSAVSLL